MNFEAKIQIPDFVKLQVKILQDKIIRFFSHNSIQIDYRRVNSDSFMLYNFTNDLMEQHIPYVETLILPYSEYSFSFTQLQINKGHKQLFLSLTFDRNLTEHLFVNINRRRLQTATNLPIFTLDNYKDEDIQPLFHLYQSVTFKFSIVHIDLYFCNDAGEKVNILVATRKGVFFQHPNYYQQLPPQLLEKAHTSTIPKERGVAYNANQSLYMQNLGGNIIFSRASATTTNDTTIIATTSTTTTTSTVVTPIYTQSITSTTTQ